MKTQAPVNVTRRVAMKAGLGTALSALSLSASRADDLPHHPKEGRIAMSHHLDTPLAAQNGQLYIDDKIQLSIEYAPEPPFSGGTPFTSPPEIVKAVLDGSRERRADRESIVFACVQRGVPSETQARSHWGSNQ